MPVGNSAAPIGKDGVVRRIGAQFHALAEVSVAFGFCALEILDERIRGAVHHAKGHPFSILFANNRSVVGAVNGEGLL